MTASALLAAHPWLTVRLPGGHLPGERSIVKRLGCTFAVAREIVALRKGATDQPVPAPEADGDHANPDGTRTLSLTSSSVRTPEQMIARSGFDLNKWEITNGEAKTWETATKDPQTGEVTVTPLWHVKIVYRERLLPITPPDWGPPPPFVPRLTGTPEQPTALVLPDMQIGYRWRSDHGRRWLDPHHDRRAIDLALQVVAATSPSVVVLLGDNLDLAPFSTRWTVQDDSRQTTQAAILELRWILWRLRSIAPSAEILYLEGNHEARLRRTLEERAPELQGIELPDGQPAVDLRTWLALPGLRIEYVEYPRPWWLWGRVMCEHGTVVGAGSGATVAKLSNKRGSHSRIQGHVHRLEVAWSSFDSPDGIRSSWAASAGSLCRGDGVVPGSSPAPNWQQGVAVIEADPDGDDVQLVRIRDGRATWGGRRYVGVDYVDELVGSSGFEAFEGPATGEAA